MKQIAMPGLLYVVGTPIGNMDDVSPRVVATLKQADMVACEDTRRTGLLLQRLGIGKTAKLVSYHKENERSRVDELVTAMHKGSKVVLVSDSGMPGISDPGAVLVAGARAAGVRVEVIDGPSAVAHAMAGSGFEGGFCFVGFMPRKGKEREVLLSRVGRYPETLVFYESPMRIGETVAELLEKWGNRAAYVARELTKLHEEWHGPDLESLAAELVGEVKGEIVLVVRGFSGEAEVGVVSDKEILARLKSGERVKDIAAWVAEIEGIAKSAAYERVQALKA